MEGDKAEVKTYNNHVILRRISYFKHSMCVCVQRCIGNNSKNEDSIVQCLTTSSENTSQARS